MLSKSIYNFVLSVIFLVLSSCTAQKNAPANGTEISAVRFGFQPNEKVQNFDQFKQRLTVQWKRPVEVVIADSYTDLVTKLANQEVDFAFLSALNFIEAESKAKIKVLLKKVYGKSESYFSAIVTLKNSKIKKLSQVRGKKVAFVDLKSTSGYLFPLALLRKEGLKDEDYTASFLGTHKAALEALKAGSVDAVAVWADDPKAGTGAWTRDLAGEEVMVLKYSDAIPNDAFVVRETLYNQDSALVLQVMESMISIGEEGGLFKQLFDIDGLATATTRHYDSVRESAHILGVLK